MGPSMSSIVSGELDVRTRHLVEQACLAGDDVAVVVEMAGLTFMDCCGYAGLVAAGGCCRSTADR